MRDDVWIGRVPRASELGDFAAVVDLCAELPCRAQRFYRSVPVLDLTVPDRESLRVAAESIEEARHHGPVLVCCALGYSRGAAAVVTWLLMTQRASSVDDAIRLVRVARPTIVLTEEQFA